MSLAARGSSRWISFADLLVCFASFLTVQWITGIMDPELAFEIHDTWANELIISSMVAWFGIELLGGGWSGGLRNWFDLSFCAVGFNLVVQYGLNYISVMQPAPWMVLVTGSVLSVLLIGGLRRIVRGLEGGSASILLVGFDVVAAALVEPLRDRIVGVLARDASGVPAGLPVLGDLNFFNDAVSKLHPTMIVVNERDRGKPIALTPMLRLHYAGVVIEDGRMLFEDVLERICWQHLRPVDLLLASPVTGNRAVKTLQAIYTNLAGLALLLLALPLLVVLGILTAIANGGSAVENVRCAGLQRIPFERVRFRTRRADGTASWMGKILTTLHLVNLPQLINVVRGEMGLFGPPPVRVEFVDRLCQLLPAYPHRFAVKPGVLGWSQANMRRAGGAGDDAVRLGYDLYYAKHQSPSFDIDILVRTLVRPAAAGRRTAGTV
jgi:lipopolysaccharide/colanic/teichoic acid biosynthesis glycosyltransferase